MGMPLRLTAAVAAAVLLLAACGGTSGSTWTIAPLHPTPTAGPSEVPGPTPAGSPDASADAVRTIELELTSALTITQGGAPVTELEVREGETIRFVLDNTANFSHNFFIGPADALSSGAISGLPGVPEWTSGVQAFEYTVTAETDGLQFACTVPGHYQSMHGTFLVVS
jgi:hypothetical protein